MNVLHICMSSWDEKMCTNLAYYQSWNSIFAIKNALGAGIFQVFWGDTAENPHEYSLMYFTKYFSLI